MHSKVMSAEYQISRGKAPLFKTDRYRKSWSIWSIGGFLLDFKMPIIRKCTSNKLIPINKTMSVQPMTKPIGEIFFYDYKYEGDNIMMGKIKIPKGKLLEKVKENLAQHRKVFDEAIIGYEKMVIEHLEKQLAIAKEGRRVDLTVHLEQPIDQTKEYERVITMLEMTSLKEIEMSEHEFAQYVMDDWQWSDQFWSSNAMYSASAMGEAKKRKLI